MNLIEFVKKYNGKKVDFDGAYGAQCVDLFRQYCKDVLEVGHTGAVEGAKDLYLNYDKLPREIQLFKKFNTRFPQVGDVCVWNGTATNQYGHVAICIGSFDDEIIVFEQNGIKQDGAKINLRSKDSFLGVLRYKGNV